MPDENQTQTKTKIPRPTQQKTAVPEQTDNTPSQISAGIPNGATSQAPAIPDSTQPTTPVQPAEASQNVSQPAPVEQPKVPVAPTQPAQPPVESVPNESHLSETEQQATPEAHATPKEAAIDLKANITKVDQETPQTETEAVPTINEAAAKLPQAPEKGGLFGGLKAKWNAHVEKNRQKAAQQGQQQTPDQATTTTNETNKKAAKAPKGKAKGDGLTEAERKEIMEAQKIYEQGLVSVRDLIAPSALEFTYSGFRVSGMYAKSFFVFDYPGFIETNWLSPIINYDVTMDTSMFVYPIDSATIMKFLRNKVAQLRSSISINAEKGNVRDPALEATLQDAEELRDSLQRGTEKMFQFSLYFTVYSEDEKKLEKITKQLETILGGKLVMLKPAALQMEHAFSSCQPLGIDELGATRNMNTGPLSTAFPFTSSDLTSNEGILYGLNRHNDSLIIFDRFKLENANSVIFAKSGAGKSYAVKLEILRSMMMGTDVIVIDPEK